MRCVFPLVVCVACGSPAEQPDAAADGTSCDPHTLSLHVLSLALPTGEPAPAKLYVEVVRDGARALFLVDTGSATTFLQLPLGTPPLANAGIVRIGCDDVSVRGYAETALGTVDGLDVIGTFGLDRFLTGPVLVDVEHARLTFHGPGEAFPEAASWPSASFDLVQSTVLAHVQLEGHEVRLLVDTGAAHTLALDEPGQPGDTPISTIDSAGNPLTLYLGTGELAIGGVDRIVPLVRAPSFPYLEDYVASLGGNIAGLLGVSSFRRALVIDPAGTISVEP